MNEVIMDGRTVKSVGQTVCLKADDGTELSLCACEIDGEPHYTIATGGENEESVILTQEICEAIYQIGRVLHSDGFQIGDGKKITCRRGKTKIIDQAPEPTEPKIRKAVTKRK